MSNERTLDTRIDVQADARRPAIDLLNQQLTDTFDLFSQIKPAHWNVKGRLSRSSVPVRVRTAASDF